MMKKQHKKFLKQAFSEKANKVDSSNVEPHTPLRQPSNTPLRQPSNTLLRQPSNYQIPKYINDPEKPFLVIPPKENGSVIESREFLWLHNDDIINFKKNKNRAPNNWKYRTKKVFYTINSSGYRAPEWNQIDWKNSIVLFGCSCTFGVGVSDDETIAHHLEKLLGRPVINLGVPGGSNNLIIQNNINLLEFYDNPYAVVNIWTNGERMNIFGEHNTYNSGSWDARSKHKDSTFDSKVNFNQLWKLTFADPYHKVGLTYYNGKVGKHLWKGRSEYSAISFFPDAAYYTDSEKHFVIDNGARDLIHPGEEIFKDVANYLYERFK